MESKKWFYSRTLWVNLLAIAALVAQSQFGFVLTPETQLSILAVLNVVLRVITKKEINWK